ncbi:3-deoxy-D-manno-octulosonic acid transferase [Antarcticibacterium sp. W02-3]|nr:3-deoxy-D-manno-octulosonic acid transferase [Antarcticibacterium sp. W02-3]
MKLFVRGRKESFSILKNNIQPGEKVIWFHVASLGEFEQGLPIMKVVKELFPAHKILVSFFSPSGYENKKNASIADVTVYLPLDTPGNARKFLDLVNPSHVIFVKYDFWPNYLYELQKREIPAILVSGGFHRSQIFFKPYGEWMRKSLKSFDHFFVQNEESKGLLGSIGFTNATVSGDTRFDRVAGQLEMDNTLDFAPVFINGKQCIVAGSTWPEDEDLLGDFINSCGEEVKIIIAPHEIKPEKNRKLKERFSGAMLLSEANSTILKEKRLLIIDNIGMLGKLYSYADVAYVGGAAGKTGLHNILEPATFGVPIVIGKNFDRFPEAQQLQKLAGLYSAATKEELSEVMEKLLQQKDFREKTGMIAGHFISSGKGATAIITSFIKENYVKSS